MEILNKQKSYFSHLGNINYSQLITIVVAVGLILLCIKDISNYGMQVIKWDLLLISGVVVFIVAVHLAFKIPTKFEEMLERLANRRALQISPEELKELKINLQQINKKLALIMGLFFMVSLLLAFCHRFGFPIPASRVPITLLECAGGFIAGVFFGHMCGYGRLGHFIKIQRITVNIQPGHPDEVGGLKPVGDFYFQQAMVVAMPAVFLAVWLLIMQFGNTQYTNWKTSYAVLLGLNIIVEILVFVIPLLSFHRIMVVEKQKKLVDADILSNEMVLAEHQLAKEEDAHKREVIKDRLSGMTKEYWGIEKMPTWPLTKGTKKVFERYNFTLLVPLMIDMVGRTSIGKTTWWQYASDIFEKVFT
ncbi:hypothetical protein ACW9KT_19610 [Hymenobacter sp. HD11105]